MIEFIVRAFVYVVMFGLSLYALSALDYARFLRKNQVIPAQLLYLLLAGALAYLAGSFILVFMYNI